MRKQGKEIGFCASRQERKKVATIRSNKERKEKCGESSEFSFFFAAAIGQPGSVYVLLYNKRTKNIALFLSIQQVVFVTQLSLATGGGGGRRKNLKHFTAIAYLFMNYYLVTDNVGLPHISPHVYFAFFTASPARLCFGGVTRHKCERERIFYDNVIKFE